MNFSQCKRCYRVCKEINVKASHLRSCHAKFYECEKCGFTWLECAYHRKHWMTKKHFMNASKFKHFEDEWHPMEVVKSQKLHEKKTIKGMKD